MHFFAVKKAAVADAVFLLIVFYTLEAFFLFLFFFFFLQKSTCFTDRVVVYDEKNI